MTHTAFQPPLTASKSHAVDYWKESEGVEFLAVSDLAHLGTLTVALPTRNTQARSIHTL
jgi:hypothetical protein